MNTEGPEGPEGRRMRLSEHLGELRGRLLRCVVSVVVLGGASLVFSREIFGLLMRPVLAALPATSMGLIYTSAIEELNVFMKVGLYTGVFLTTPVLLWQIWGFVSPGLYEKERKLAAPFVLSGTVAFLVGASFCYFAVLPSMFRFLLNEAGAGEALARVEAGELKKALAWLEWEAGEVGPGKTLGEALAGLEGVEGALDGDATQGLMVSGLELLRMAGQKPGALGGQVGLAVASHEAGAWEEAREAMERAMHLAAGGMGAKGQSFRELWELELRLAKARVFYRERAQTRPMLTMKEQLSLVLLLEMAFGVIFELPVVMALLALMGLVHSRTLFKYQRHAVVVSLIVAAIITPTGDAVNLALMAVPIVLCYELGVLLVWGMEKRTPSSPPENSF